MSKTVKLDSLTLNEKFTSTKLKTIAGILLGGALVLSGCATKPVYKNASPKILVNERGVPNYYKVRAGDTVSEISARYGLNYRQVGALNRLDSRYTIYTGQWLKLWDSNNNWYSMQPKPVNQNNHQQTRPINNTTTVPQTPQPAATQNQTILRGYKYPTSNPVIKNFNASTGEMGMWFSGRVGDPIVASKSGVVMYAGNGLPEYGNLIMIRHDDRYVTVYAHNNQMLVKENEQVQQGQRIATMGSSGQTNQVALQFQIRENGTPIDPRSVLGL